MKKVTMGSVTA